MGIILLYSLLYIVFILVDFLYIYKHGEKRVSKFYLSLTLFSYILIVFTGLGFTVPSPAIFIKKILSFVVPL